jgi:hypothetical protein
VSVNIPPVVLVGSLGLILIAALFHPVPSLGHQDQPLRHAPISTPFSDAMVTLTVSLAAMEDTLPPLGIPPQPQPDVGFATVVVRLANQQETHQSVTLQSLEIRSEPEQQLEPFAFTPQRIGLKPLEHAVLDIHLRKPALFLAKDRVKAIVRYQIGPGPVLTVASEAVTIERR